MKQSVIDLNEFRGKESVELERYFDKIIKLCFVC